VFEGFTFHLLRHTAASLMALAGMDPAAAAERLEHSDGGALFHKTYAQPWTTKGQRTARKPPKGITKPIVRMALTGQLSNPPEPLVDLLSFFELIHEEPKKKRKKT
jgi:hypothetical protein